MISFKWSPLKHYVITIILSYSHLRCWILTLKQQNWKKQRIKFISVVRGKKRFATVSDLQKEVLWKGDHFEDSLLVFSGCVNVAWCRHFIWPVQDVRAKLSGTEGWREVLLSGADLWEPPDISDKGVKGRAWVWASSAARCSHGRVERKKRPKSLPLASAPEPTLFCFCGGVDASGWDGPERGSGQVVPGLHWEQDTGFRNHHKPEAPVSWGSCHTKDPLSAKYLICSIKFTDALWNFFTLS